MSVFLDAALEYAALVYPVFPCANGLKPTPLTSSGFKEASTEPEQIAAWWSRHPAASIGLATAGLLVVDVDGADNPWLTAQRMEEPSQGPTARTPSGGWHFVFLCPPGVAWRCSAGLVAESVDIRTDGGYIVVAPSVRPDGNYRWIEGLALDVSRDRLPTPPDWLIEILDDLEKPKKRAPVNSKIGALPTMVENLIPNGQRNATLARLAGSMRRTGMSRGEIVASLHKVNGDRCLPPLEPTEVERIATSIARYEPDAVNVGLIENHWGQMFSPEAEPESSVIWFSNIEPVDVKWLWPQRIPAGRISLLVGLPGKGKSLVTLDAAARVSTGKAWPDGTPCPQGSAILITAEDNPNDTIRPRLDAAGGGCAKMRKQRMLPQKTNNLGILNTFRELSIPAALSNAFDWM